MKFKFLEKRFLVLVWMCFLFINSFGQWNKLGASKNDVLQSYEQDPCKLNDRQIWYCFYSGDKVCFSMESGRVVSVLYMKFFNSKTEAQADVKKEIISNTNSLGRPEMKDDQAFWFVREEVLMIA